MKTVLYQLAFVFIVSVIVFAAIFHFQPKDDAVDVPVTPPVIAEPMVAVETLKAEEPKSRYNPDIPLSDDLQEALFDACEEFCIDPAVALGLIQKESEFNVDAISKKGCYGLCQLNPKYFPSGLSPAENIRYGIEYLAFQLTRYNGDMKAALTAFNAGHDTGKRSYANAVLKYADEWEERLSNEDY